MIMKKMDFCVAVMIASIVFTGCSDVENSEESSGTAASTTDVIVQTTNDTDVDPDLAVDGDPLNCILYEGTYYYGLCFYGDEPFMPEDAVYIGESNDASYTDDVSLSSTTNIPTEELQTNWTNGGAELYATFDGDTIIAFYATITDDHATTSYVSLENLRTDAPDYYAF